LIGSGGNSSGGWLGNKSEHKKRTILWSDPFMANFFWDKKSGDAGMSDLTAATLAAQMQYIGGNIFLTYSFFDTLLSATDP